MTNRRAFVLTTAAAVLASPISVPALQVGKMRRIGYLGLSSAGTNPTLITAFREQLRQRGWIDGKTVTIEIRYADGRADRLPGLVAELIGLDVEVIVTSASATARAAKNATTSIPIVMAASADAVGEGLVASLAHPGGNITGSTFLAGAEMVSKQLQLLHEVAPRAVRVAVLTNPKNHSHPGLLKELESAAPTLRLQVTAVEGAAPEHLERAFAAMTNEGAGALLVLTDAMFIAQRRRLAELAANAMIPALYSQREFVAEGGLISYGPSIVDMYRRAADLVDKILRGTKPGDIPVERPTKFELVINLRTAKTLQLEVPRSLVIRADDVIE